MAFTSKIIGASLVKRTIQDINAHMISNVGDKINIAIHLNMLDPSTRLWLVYLLDHLGNQKAKGGLISMCKICLPIRNGLPCYLPRDKFYMRYDKGPWMLVCPIAAAGGSIAGYNFEFDINILKGKRPEDVINNIIFKENGSIMPLKTLLISFRHKNRLVLIFGYRPADYQANMFQ